ncbi:MAG: hypothetical protein ACE5GU_09825 [Candidatus Scalinduaceae bacterium]
MNKQILAFSHAVKTGGITFSSILRNNFRFSYCHATQLYPNNNTKIFDSYLSPRDFNAYLHMYPKIRCFAGHLVRATPEVCEKHPQINFITFLRRPISRYFSTFQWILKEKGLNRKELEECIINSSNQWHRSNYLSLFLSETDNAHNAIKYIKQHFLFVGILERFDESLIVLRTLLNGDIDCRYERRNVSKVNSNEEYLTKKTVDYIKAKNESDIMLYNYFNQQLTIKIKELGIDIDAELAILKDKREGFKFSRSKLCGYRVGSWLREKVFLSFPHKILL